MSVLFETPMRLGILWWIFSGYVSSSWVFHPLKYLETYLQSGRRNVDLDLAFSHKKRGKDLLLEIPADCLLFVSFLFSRLSSVVCHSCSLCSSPFRIVYLLLLKQLSPKHKRSFKQVNDGMFLPLVSSSTPWSLPPPFISHDEDNFALRTS